MDDALGPPEKMSERADELTPMMAQYYELCKQYDEALVLFQVGDFYEAFCEAAETVARTCETTLTEREDSTGEYAMAGVPIDNAESYIETLLDAGYRVAVADQIENPEETSGVVERAVTRIITPGTLTEEELLDSERNNYVAAVTAGETFGLAVLDISTGDFYATSDARETTVRDELERFDPAEAIIGPDAPPELLPEGCVQSPYSHEAFDTEQAREMLRAYFGSPERLLGTVSEIRACGALLSYAEYARAGETEQLGYLNHLTRYSPQEYMLLDAVALDSLELFERRAVRGRDDATLAGVIDETASALGRRTLDDWLRRPLIDRETIVSRHDAVGELHDSVRLREQLHEQLREVYDIERLISRISRGRANARDLRSLKDTLDVVSTLTELLADTECEKLNTVREQLDPLTEIRTLIEEAIKPDPAREITEGDIIRPSYDEQLARLRETEREGKDWIEDLEASEREKTGIDSLTVGHSSVHGYYIEVTNANLDRVPDHYERRQTLKNAERYCTQTLKDREDEILRAERRADTLEYELFCEVRSTVTEESARIQSLAETLGRLDVLVSFGTVAAEHGYTRPVVADPATESEPEIDGIHIEEGRHPVVERTESSFVPNDTQLDQRRRLAVITGPNMSGKSTYMRQIALLVVLAQAGSFLPASEARLQIIDRIFTRVGASDDIAGGRSTFMIEMSELATILKQATDQSLVLLDEVGRGTSTADGKAIAQAVTEYLHDEVGALTLFATHHHDLTAVADRLDAACNLSFETSQTENGVVFEHALTRGTADASYGVEVAATAGVEDAVVDRARALLEDTSDDSPGSVEQTDSKQSLKQLQTVERTNGTDRETRLQETLAEIDIATTTPLEALETLSELKRQLD